jgi:phage terminase small subunit
MAGNKNSGRLHKPAAHLKLHNQYRADRHGNRAAEAKADGEPLKPTRMSADERWMWKLVDSLTSMGVTKKIDTPHVWSMCEMWGLYRQSVVLAKADPTDKDARIAVVSYWTAFEAAAAKCGLTPTDRAKLTVPREIVVDEFEEFLKA